MRIKEIKLKNYRNFLDSSFKFSTDNNINLIIGNNGSGKTELLYSFWWVLYGFDFSVLKSKIHVSHSLNKDLYEELKFKPTYSKETSKVTLIFEHIDIYFENSICKYEIVRTEDFINYPDGIRQSQHIELIITKDNGETLPPIREYDEYLYVIRKIIPREVLNTVLFDGENMRTLGQENENSNTTIKGIITDLTNREVFTRAYDEFESLKKEFTKELKKSSTGKEESERIELSEIEDEIYSMDNMLEETKELYKNTKQRISEITDLQKNQKELQKFINLRNDANKNIENFKKNETEILKNLSTELRGGYQLILTSLLIDIESKIKLEKIPLGLTVEAVNSILSEDICICGEHLNEVNRLKLISLLNNLPPDNVNALILEKIRNIRNNKEEINRRIKDELKRYSENIKSINNEKEIQSEATENIKNLSIENTLDLENEYEDLVVKRTNFSNSIFQLENDIAKLKQTKKSLDEKVKGYDLKKKNRSNIEIQYNFIEKSMKLIRLIVENNQFSALKRLNELLEFSYKEFSPEYQKGTRIYIVKHYKPYLYMIITYNQNAFSENLENGRYNDKFRKYFPDEEYSDDLMKEVLILELAGGSSTGQAKTNTLSFVKAISDYAKEEKTDHLISETKDFPIIIDAPFTELSGDTLKKSYKNISNFGVQIIIMVDKDSYFNGKEYIDGFISNKYFLESEIK